MEFEKLINECISMFQKTPENSEFLKEKFQNIIDVLLEMKIQIENNTYPKNLNHIPVMDYIRYDFVIEPYYGKLSELNEWYKDNYHEKHPLEIKREMNKKYLMENLALNEKMANKALLKLTLHNKGDLYFEFSEFVETGSFVRNGIKVEGYTAEDLFNTGNLSVLGAYNYLIYLRENPKEALADLKAGLPRK